MREPTDNVATEVRLHRRFGELAESDPDRLAVVHLTKPITYAEIARDAEKMVGWMLDQGIRPGDRVGVSVADQYLHLLACLGLLRMGCLQMCLPTFEPADALQSLSDRLTLSWQITEQNRSFLRGPVRLELPEIEVLRGDGSSCSVADQSAAFPSVIVMTSSGSTGHPKLIPVTELNLFAGLSNLGSGRDVSHQRISIEHSFGKKRFLQSLFTGGTIVSSENGTLDTIADTCRQYGVTRLFLSAYAARQLLSELAMTDAARPVCPEVELGLYGSKIPPDLIDALCAQVSPRVSVIYGAQEVGVIARANSEDLRRCPETVGRPVRGVELQVVDNGFQPLPIGVRGLVGIRGARCVDRYLFDDALSARMFRDGWFYPGDVGMLTEDGELIFVGRKDDAIILNSINIFPVEIEQAVLRCPGVDDAFAFPLESGLHNQIPVVAYASRVGVGPADVMKHCRSVLGMRAPRKAFRVESVPRNADGKVLKPKLLQLIGSAAGISPPSSEPR